MVEAPEPAAAAAWPPPVEPQGRSAARADQHDRHRRQGGHGWGNEQRRRHRQRRCNHRSGFLVDLLPSRRHSAPTAGTLAFSVALTVSATHDVGNTQFGKRRQLDVSGGTITGDKLKGTVLTGGLDYELTLSNGAMELEEVLIWKTSDNISIFVRVCGVAAAGNSVVRIVPDIEAPTSGSYAWLNTTKLVGTRKVDAAGNKITLDVYDVSKATAGEPKVQLRIDGRPQRVVELRDRERKQWRDRVHRKRHARIELQHQQRQARQPNVIPITGGTTTGKVAGKILNGGADYQLAGSGGTTLDARYTLAPSNGEFIIVRNCGPINGLVPVFEARTDGSFAFLNTGKFLSSAPGGGSGGVSITFSTSAINSTSGLGARPFCGIRFRATVG